MIQDSGERREFESGAVRDIVEGKGRCDLLPLDIIAEYLNDKTLSHIYHFTQSGEPDAIYCALNEFIKIAFNDSWTTAILEVAKHYEDGCKKYGERNWEKGIPLHCYIDSAIRHYLKWGRKDKDERHDRAFVWNMIGAVWTLKHHPELNDLPMPNKTK